MKSINEYIDHTLLKPEATPEMIEKLCQEAIEYKFFSVCVNSCYVKLASNILKNSSVKTVAVVGFPLGCCTTETKVFEAIQALEEGASEVDMVINIGALKNTNYHYVIKDIKSVSDAAHTRSGLVKVILETSLLSNDEIVKACNLAVEGGADFVKTSTGFIQGGARIEDVALMRKTVGNGIGVKASGGIRDRKTAESMIKAGADRLGTSASIKIVTK